MKIYLVGGAVRDELLGLPVKERDWVVVGATPDDLLNQGFRQVGKEFPVFLHPKTREEYALARMERKVKPGYQGFVFDTSPNVSLEDDLIRRDLTINAMAKKEDGELIDPYHGKDDLEKKILRHVSMAFSEDPVRILRTGRFLARYAQYGFQVATETIELMRRMVDANEVNALVAERVWKELERALGEKNPEKFFEVLNDCGALSIIFPGMHIQGAGIKALMAATALTKDPVVRFAALLHDSKQSNSLDIKKEVAALAKRFRAPILYKDLAVLVAQYYKQTITSEKLNGETIFTLFSKLDIYRRKNRLNLFLTACRAIANSKSIAFNPKPFIACADAALSVNIQSLLHQGLAGNEIGEILKKKRLEKINEQLYHP